MWSCHLDFWCLGQKEIFPCVQAMELGGGPLVQIFGAFRFGWARGKAKARRLGRIFGEVPRRSFE